MNHRILIALGVVVTLLTAPAGCGIPGHTDVRVDGGSQTSGGGSAGLVGREPPKRADSGDKVEELAENFLHAAAGEAGSAYERVSEFVAPASRTRLPRQDVNVVRLIKDGLSVAPNDEGTKTVTIAVQQVGVLRPNGVLDPPELLDTSYTFEVGKVAAGDIRKPADLRRPEDDVGLYVLDPPPVLLMTDDALTVYYQQRTIYFWSRDGGGLVPDQRYLPLSVPTGRWPTEVLGWLTGGPAEWLKGSVDGLPAGTETIGNAAQTTEDTLVVNLAMRIPAAALEAQLKRLSTQLAWSLREIYPRGRLELQIRDQQRRVFDVDEQRRLNPVYQVDEVSRYCVFAGAIHRADPADAAPEPPPVSPADNRGIVSADVARSGGRVLAALVTSRGQLIVGAGPATAAGFKASGRFGNLGQPTWLRGSGSPHPIGLVVADGKLLRFGVDARLVSVQLPGAPGPVTAVAAALDGQRIAFIAGQHLYVASITTATSPFEVGRPRLVPTSLRRPTAVAWHSDNRLVVAGENATGRTALYDVTVDGAVESSRVDDLGKATVSHLAAYPYNPVRGDGPFVMYEANKAAWTDAPVVAKIEANQLQGVEHSAAAGGAAPTAPFFLF